MSTIAQHVAYYARQKETQLRTLLRRDFGSRKYRITNDAVPEVHVYGRMPNSIETGWWLKGSLWEVEREYCI